MTAPPPGRAEHDALSEASKAFDSANGHRESTYLQVQPNPGLPETNLFMELFALGTLGAIRIKKGASDWAVWVTRPFLSQILIWEAEADRTSNRCFHSPTLPSSCLAPFLSFFVPFSSSSFSTSSSSSFASSSSFFFYLLFLHLSFTSPLLPPILLSPLLSYSSSLVSSSSTFSLTTMLCPYISCMGLSVFTYIISENPPNGLSVLGPCI